MFRILAVLLLLGLSAAAQTNPPAGGIRITLERRGSGMDLSLPEYKLTLEGDGSVLFEGKHHVSAMGLHKGRIRPEVVTDLAHQFEAIGYFDFPKHLGSCEDAAIVVTSATVGSRNNEVLDWGCGNNVALTKLEDDTDRVSNSQIWTRGRIPVWIHWPWFHSQT